MDSKGEIFREAEIDANKYASRCLIISSFISGLIWILNIIGFFTVEPVLMNLAMSFCIIVLISPTILLHFFHVQGDWVKYYITICFVVGIAILYMGMTYHAILAWACPILLSCHFYSPKVTKATFITALILLFVTIWIGALVGTWDCNMLDSTSFPGGSSVRLDYLIEQQTLGQSTLSNILTLYYIPRALILTVVYIIGINLSKRTHNLLDRQQEDLHEKERIDSELSIATEIQKSMIPNTFPAFPTRQEFDLYGTMIPSKEVGGDFYDFFFVDDDHLALVIADVSGKGIPAAMFMMATKIIIKNLTTIDKKPSQVLMEVNEQLCETNENDMFVTVWFGIYEISTGKVIASNAGHEYPIIYRHNTQSYSTLKDSHGFVVGGMENMKYKDYEFQLEKNDILFVYTDGILEAIDCNNNAYGMERLLNILNSSKGEPLEVVLNRVTSDVNLFADTLPQFDDITMLTISRNNE